MRRTAAFLATLQLFAVAPLLSQAAAPEPLALAARPGPEGQPRIRRLLKEAYRLRLVSDWPQLTVPGTSCTNGGTEVLTGTLSRTGGGYAGQLERSATIQFCGVHGILSPAPCELTLTSRGPVLAHADVILERDQPTAVLRWTANRAALTEITVAGTCAATFNQSLRDLYLGVIRELEFPLPREGEAGLPQRLDDYGWIVAVW